MRKLILADGTEYILDWWNGDKGVFFANIQTSEGIGSLAVKLSNPELTSEMTVRNGEAEFRYSGYTELASIAKDGWNTGWILVSLRMPEL